MRVGRSAVVVLLTVHAAMLAWQAFRYSPTTDEPAHLVSGLGHWELGRFDLYRVNPHLVRSAASFPITLLNPQYNWDREIDTPYARPEFPLGTAFSIANGPNVFWYFTLSRWACIPLSLLGGCVCFLWARDLYGLRAGLLALSLWCFCPNILGNGALITPDVGASAVGVLCNYCFWRWLKRPTWMLATIAGLTLGAAEMTKSTWIILFGLWPFLYSLNIIHNRFARPLFVDAGLNRPTEFAPASSAQFRRKPFPYPLQSLQLGWILLFGVYVLNLGYGFEDTFQRLDQFQFISRTLGGENAHATPGNRFQGTWMGMAPVPLPANYLRGLDVQKRDFEVGKVSYLRGVQKTGGWWYYYIYAILTKTPAGSLLLFALVCVLRMQAMLAQDRRACAGHDLRQFAIVSDQNKTRSPITAISDPPIVPKFIDDVLILLPLLTILALVSSQTGFNRYLRYVLPIYPLAFIWMSQVVSLQCVKSQGSCSNVANGMGQWPSFSIWFRQLSFGRPGIALNAVVTACLVSSIVSSLCVFPHCLSYFNEVSGGPRNGEKHLLDGNIDWGQDVFELKRWCAANPTARPLYLAYFGANYAYPRIAGIDFEMIPARHSHGERQQGRIETSALKPGWYALSVNELYGYDQFDVDRFACFRQKEPLARIGFSIRIYEVSDGPE